MTIVNCLEVETTALCALKNVEVLSLNGLRGAEGCRNSHMIPFLGSLLQSKVNTEIPSCLWCLKNLTTLHLAGNGYVGEVEISDTGRRLSDVTLSHNRLSGTIPSAIQELATVDLSHNRFVGHISEVTGISNQETMLHTTNNRLSGRLPTSDLVRVANLDILHGNMFSCDSIPENDTRSFGYICGILLSCDGCVLFGYPLCFRLAIV